jgi:outer membrane protein assembly factor BamB
MSIPDTPPSNPRKRSFLRFWLPCLIVALPGAVIGVLWAWPASDIDGGYRFADTLMLCMLMLLLLGLWFLFFSGLRWWVRLGVPLLVIAGLVGFFGGAVRHVAFSGDMVPHFHFTWEKSRADILKAHREKQQDAAASLPPIDLAGTESFPGYRGEQRDGVVHGPALARQWKSPLTPLWRQPCGAGYASFAVAGNGAVTIEQRGDQEAVACYDVASGKERWVFEYPANFQERMGGPGPRATPAIADGKVYSLGAEGKLMCLDGTTGAFVWQADMLNDNKNLPWAMAGSPLVYDDVVVVNPGTQTPEAKGRALVAFDRATGKEVWHAGDNQAAYSSPMLATLSGRRQILLFDGEGLAGYDDKGGGELWRKEWVTPPQKINVAQPLVLDGDRIFITSGYGIGCAMLKVTQTDGKWDVKELWKNKAMRCKFSSPVAYQGHLYGLDDGVLTCLEQETGKKKWRDGHYGHGQVLLAGDLLVVLGEHGELALVEATPEGFHEKGNFTALEGDRTWNPHAIAGGKAFVRNHLEMACYDLRPQGEK